jgi:hypothetical protein
VKPKVTNAGLDYFKQMQIQLLKEGLMTTSGNTLSSKFFNRFFNCATPKQLYYLSVYLRIENVKEKSEYDFIDPHLFYSCVETASNVMQRNIERLGLDIVSDLPVEFREFVYIANNSRKPTVISHHLFKFKHRNVLENFLLYLKKNYLE